MKPPPKLRIKLTLTQSQAAAIRATEAYRMTGSIPKAIRFWIVRGCVESQRKVAK